MNQEVSASGVAFTGGHEGRVLNAYRDPVGIWTIGIGFTTGSHVFASYWRATRGHSLRAGDKITPAECDMLLKKLLDEEYGPAVTGYVGKLAQHVFDASDSAVYNLGKGAIKWRWGRALKAGDIDGAAQILGSNYNTANGRKLPGLVRRRKEEAHLMRTGEYAGVKTVDIDQVGADAGMLKSLGYNVADFKAATRAFQRDNPPLAVDGKFGPATRSAAIRAIEAKKAANVAVGGGVGGSGGGAVAVKSAGVDPWTLVVYGATAVIVLGLLWLAYRYRGRLWLLLPERVRDFIVEKIGD